MTEPMSDGSESVEQVSAQQRLDTLRAMAAETPTPSWQQQAWIPPAGAAPIPGAAPGIVAPGIAAPPRAAPPGIAASTPATEVTSELPTVLMDNAAHAPIGEPPLALAESPVRINSGAVAVAERPGNPFTAPSGAGDEIPTGIPGGAQLDARNVSAWFGNAKVLERVSLTMEPQTVTALIGPSGCGKSTFLRTLNRMHELIPSAQLAGEVLLNGDDIYAPGRRITETRKRIGMVFQKPNPFPAMTIGQNVVAGLKLAGIKVSSSEREELIERSLRRASLWNEVKDRLDQPGGGLSGGQQQRLCIARSLAVQPDVLLMDEPCSALDPTSTRRVEETIHDLREEVTIVIVTHNMQQAQRVSQQCAFFLAEQGTPGGIVESGRTEDLFTAPNDPRTEDYVGGRFG